MDFSINEEQKTICESIKELCQNQLNNNVFSDDEEAVFPLEKWKMLGDFGVHGLPIPVEYNGLGLDMLTTALAIEALGYSCRDEGLVFSICAHMLTCAVPIFQFGTDEQKKKYLPDLACGKLIGGNGISESEAGSDLSDLQTKAEKKDDHFLLNGTKIFVTNGPQADLLLIYARHPEGIRMLDISAFIVETDQNSVKIGQVFKKMGLRTSPLSEIILDNCQVNNNNLLGRERLGMKVFNLSMLWERIVMAAYQTGAMQYQYEKTLAYAKTRKQFQEPILKFDRVADKLIDMYKRLEMSRLLLYKTAWKYDRENCDLNDAALLKIVASDAKVKNSLDAVQVHGAYGYLKESEVEKELRDSICAPVYSGTSEIQKKIIADQLHTQTWEI